MTSSACIVNQLQGIVNKLPLCWHVQNTIIDTVLLRTAQVLYQSPLLLALWNDVQRTDFYTLEGRGVQREGTDYSAKLKLLQH